MDTLNGGNLLSIHTIMDHIQIIYVTNARQYFHGIYISTYPQSLSIAGLWESWLEYAISINYLIIWWRKEASIC